MMSGIDQSLNLLKSLQQKLKYQNQRHTTTFNLKTQQDEDLPQTKKKQWASRLITQYETNQEKILQENKYLKRYVNKLLKMNDYLKNQLIKKDKYSQVINEKKDNSEVELLKIQIEYLQELNREKQLQLKLLTHSKKKHKRSSSNQHFSMQTANKNPKNSHQRIPALTNYNHKTHSNTKTFRKQGSINKTIRNNNTKYSTSNRCHLCYH